MKKNKALSFIKISEKSRRNESEGGFTLIEILMVVIIIGIILALAAPNFTNGYGRFQLNKTVDDLLSVSRWAQAMAIGQQRTFALFFSEDRRSYDIETAVFNQDDNTDDNFVAVNGSLGRMHEIPDAVNLNTDKDRVEFYSDGTIDEATIELNTHEQKTELSSAKIRGMMTRVNDE